jgi:hypothetical protein
MKFTLCFVTFLNMFIFLCFVTISGSVFCIHSFMYFKSLNVGDILLMAFVLCGCVFIQ